MIGRQLPPLVAVLAVVAVASGARAGAFVDAVRFAAPDVITHPTGYTGSGGTITVDVCIDSTSANASSMVRPVQNAIATWNSLQPSFFNLVSALTSDTDVPVGAIDFESVVLHELGHCIGLAHSNLASESGVATADQDYTKSDPGTGGYDLGRGADNLRATGDDQRGNDVNFYWYENGQNDPFRIGVGVVDATTYSVALNNLPPGDSFAASADRNNAGSFTAPLTEAVMNQGTYPSEEQRLITADEVSALRLARAGVDSIAGTSDDYTVVLSYAGSSPSPSCDINIDFDNAQTSLAVCGFTSTRIGNPRSNDRRITSADIYFNTDWNWHFTSESCGNGVQDAATETCDDGNLLAGDGCSQTCTIENDWACTGFPSTCAPVVCGNDVIEPGETCDDGGTAPGDGCDPSCQLESGWSCSGEPSVCGEVCGDGITTASEACDDGGTTPGDGCDASCQLESGWSCSGEPSVCGEVCGDGIVTASEGCDDGGTTPGDGCDAACRIEPGASCGGEPSLCEVAPVDVLTWPTRGVLVMALALLGVARREIGPWLRRRRG